MMSNLFSIFDPSNSSFFKLNWLVMFLYFFMLPCQYWFMPNRYNFLFFLLLINLKKEIKSIINKNQFINIYLMMSIFLYISYNNFMGLFPYNFTSTSHICITIPLAMSLWLCFNLYNIIMKFNKLMSHMIPKNTPIMLSFFICIIETISMFSRPISLSIRLAANMIAGHLLLNLLSSMIYNIFMWTSIMTPLMMLLFLEMMVSIIQSYVFILLVVMYMNETK
uniref:ATP synthase subunit a n=1 Tax=Dermanyssus gallinae TaxID=34641 RepID=A0A7U3PYA1_9ACAR|nr:ATP synthase F0 subunit 6 [Dermanyssus gallinae]QPG86042.1 ATP synthase F0 subunit 6 [Dermanyssus gallinae]